MRLRESSFNVFFRKLRGNIPSLIIKLLMFTGANAIAQLFSAIYLLQVARWFLQEKYGVFAGCYAAATVSSFLVNWGMDTWLLRQASTCSNPLQLTGTVLKTKTVLGIGWAVVLWAVLTGLRPDFYAPAVLALVIFDTWFDTGLITLSAYYNATGRTSTISILLITTRGLRMISATLLILFQFTDIVPFVAVRLFFTALVFFGALFNARPDFSESLANAPRAIWRQSLPYAATDIMAAIYSQIDVFLLSILSSKVATGIYAPAVALVNAIITMIVSGFWLFVPYLTRIFQENPARLRKIFYQVMALLLAAGSAIALFIALLGPFFANLLLGQAYQVSGVLLVVMSPILFFKALSVGFSAYLVAIQRQHERLLPQVISASTNLLLNLWAIPRWGPGGAAMVYLISEAILTLGYAIRTYFALRGTL